MNVIEELQKLNAEVDKARLNLKRIEQKRIDWCNENRKEVKKLYPRKNIVYEIIDASIDLPDYLLSEYDSGETFYFKTTNPRFYPQRDFGYADMPQVDGFLLDSSLKEIDRYARVSVTNLKQPQSSNKQNKHTKVYVMIDKNTGYYKIGRSVRPKRRERTLQSEKPTIELLFYKDAKVKDEKELHEMFADKRVRGEWFDLSGSDLTRVRQYFE